MKCSNCGQIMIDKKEYCISCGKKLYEEKEITKRNIFIIFAFLIILGIFICYMIINYNVDEEIEPYIDKEIKEEINKNKI